MKRLLLIPLLMASCTTYRYDVFNTDGTPKESFSYTRPLGKKDIKGLYVYVDAKGKRVLKVQSATSNEEKLVELLSSVLEAGKAIGAATATGGLPVRIP